MKDNYDEIIMIAKKFCDFFSCYRGILAKSTILFCNISSINEPEPVRPRL